MCSKYLDERDLQRRDLAMQENSCEIELDLETDVDICSVDCWRPTEFFLAGVLHNMRWNQMKERGHSPPECKATIGDLVETGSLGIGEFFEFHALCEMGG
jgi:hypothetical protein